MSSKWATQPWKTEKKRPSSKDVVVPYEDVKKRAADGDPNAQNALRTRAQLVALGIKEEL